MSGPEYRAYHELLAVIHRDGGQHTYHVGLAQSICDAAEICHKWKTMPEELAALQAEVEELRRDRERLDFLESRHVFNMRRAMWENGCPIEIKLAGMGEIYSPTVRQAIDAAIAADK